LHWGLIESLGGDLPLEGLLFEAASSLVVSRVRRGQLLLTGRFSLQLLVLVKVLLGLRRRRWVYRVRWGWGRVDCTTWFRLSSLFAINGNFTSLAWVALRGCLRWRMSSRQRLLTWRFEEVVHLRCRLNLLLLARRLLVLLRLGLNYGWFDLNWISSWNTLKYFARLLRMLRLVLSSTALNTLRPNARSLRLLTHTALLNDQDLLLLHLVLWDLVGGAMLRSLAR